MGEEATANQEPVNDTTRRLFEMEKAFHDCLVAESDRATRKRMYREFYESLTAFFLEQEPEKRSFGSFTPALMRLLFPFLRNATVLDFGCGYGSATFEFAKCARQVLAADVSAPMIEAIRHQMKENKVQNIDPILLGYDPAHAMERWDSTIDVVYSNDTVEHLHPDDMQEHLTLMLRLLRPGGLYICITPNRVTGPHDVSSHFLPYHSMAQGAHIHEYSHRELCGLFWRSGFVKVRTPITALGYDRLSSDTAFRSLLAPPRYKFWLESLWFQRTKTHRAKLLNFFCLNKVILFAWKK